MYDLKPFGEYISEMSNLGGSTLYKYDWRAAVFLRKYQEKEEFELTNGRKVEFVPNKKVVDAVKKHMPTRDLRLLDKNGNEYKFNQLAKSAEFGGKGAGFGTAKEDVELASLQKQIEQAKVQEGSATIKVRVGKKTYDVAAAETTPGTPKSDFHLVDNDGKEVVWISHKDGRSSKDFQQWGGVSKRSEPAINAHRETQKFIADLKKAYPAGLPRATTLFRKIKDTKLKMLSVYGNQYGKALGRQNTSVLLQGPVKLVKKGKFYQLDANHVHYNGDSVDAGGFEPVLMAIYKGDRDNEGLKGTRLAIQPIMSRRAVEFK